MSASNREEVAVPRSKCQFLRVEIRFIYAIAGFCYSHEDNHRKIPTQAPRSLIMSTFHTEVILGDVIRH